MNTLLSINNYYYYRGGAETVFLEHNRLFEQCGWQVVPFAMQHPQNLDTEWSAYFVDEIEFGQSYSLSDKLTKAAKAVYSLEARRKLLQLLRRARPTLCHAHNIYHHISPSILGLLRAEGVPTVVTLHDLKVACPAYTMLREGRICERCKDGKLYNVLLNRCIKGSAALSAIALAESWLHRLLRSYLRNVDAFVVPSRFYIDKLVEWGLPEEKFFHIPNFVFPERYRPEYNPGGAFVYFGRLSTEKGLTTLIRAAAKAGTPVRIIGTGPKLNELEALARTLCADVAFLGYLTGEALHEQIRSARAVVLPSEWYENAPMSVLEAYALGKPVIGARIGGIPEQVEEGQTGFTFSSGDVDDLARQLRHVADLGDGHVAALGDAGRRWVIERFAAEAYLDRTLELYRRLGVEMRREEKA